MQVAVVEKTFRIVGKGSLMAQFTLYLFRHTAYLVSGCGPADGGPLQRVAYRRLHHYLYQWPPSWPAQSTLVLNPPSRRYERAQTYIAAIQQQPLLDLLATHIGHRQTCLEYELTQLPKKSQLCQPQQ